MEFWRWGWLKIYPLQCPMVSCMPRHLGGARIRCLRSSGYRESLFAGMRFGWGGSNCYRYSSGKYMRLSFSHTRFDTLAL